ncbi:S-layer homology domain-containing protein [Geobacillus sp. AYS3]|uniref:S-layer homology domain-containing protein n=1 Tax=Geobacillus sp. AYS3 TaxID=2603623 RepID=UPI002570B86A|nr:S-layer homology domain-containing protein [Geobacillus sp. AYS3]
MAYQPKSYRKFLAGSVSAALVATAVGPVVANAASFSDVNPNDSHAANINALVELGYIKGFTDGTFKPYQSITRGQVAKIFARILTDQGFKAPDKIEQVFDDVPLDAKDQELVKAAAIVKAAGVMTGSQGKLNPAQNITREQMAKVLVEAFDLTRPADFKSKITDLDKADPSFRDYIQTLEANGVTVVTEYRPKDSVTRAAFASFVKRALDVSSVVTADDITAVKFVDENTLEVTFNGELKDVKKEDFSIEGVEIDSVSIKAAAAAESKTTVVVIKTKTKLEEGKTYTVSYKGKTTDKTKVEVPVVTPKVESVSAINAKTLKVTFNKAVDDTKAKFEVKKGSVTVNVAKTTFSADKKSVELELASKLFEGEYTVNVTGLADQALTGSVKVENEKVAKIELLGEVAPVVVEQDGDKKTKKKATVAYRVFNQYGEDITKSPLAASISWTASNGVDAQDDDKGVLTLTNTSDFKIGDKVAITGINVSTNTVVSGVVTISDASATDTVEFVGIYNKDGKEFSGDLAVGDFVLLLNAKDQYGNDVNASKVNDDVVFTSSNPSVLAIDKAYDGQGKDKDKIGLKFTAGPNYANGGKVIITAISKTSGKVAQFEVNVKAAPALDTFTLGTPTEIVAAGETVKLPFTAVDQYGNTVTKYEALEDKVTFNTEKAKLVKDASGNAVLEYTAPDTKGLQVLVATVKGSGKVSQLTIDVKEAAYAATIESLKNVTTTVAKDGKVEISLSNLVVKDQYGRTFDLKDKLTNTENEANLGKYKIVVTDSTGGAVKVEGNGTEAEITANDGKITITGLEKGSEEVTFKLQRVEKNADNTYKFNDVATSPLKVTFNTVDKSAFTSFEIGEIGKLYADGSANTHAKALKVYGVKADGTKVELPSNYYNVIVDDEVLAFTGGKLDVKLDAKSEKFGTKDEITTKVTVIVEGAEDPVTLSKDIVVSKVAPKADKIEFTDAVKNGTASIAVDKLKDDTDAAALSAVLKVTDQYGVEITDLKPIITVTNVKEKTVDADPNNRFNVVGNGSNTIDIQNAEAGDTFTVTYLLDGKTATVKFTVVADKAEADKADKAEADKAEADKADKADK